MGNSIESNICDAIDIIVDRAIDRASFDKTIQATIVSLEDKSTGKYKVRYQDSLFYAFSNDIDITYSSGTLVYILVPANDMKNTKHILGSASKLGTEYVRTDLNKEETFVYIGNNCVNDNGQEFGLHSYLEGGEYITLYDAKESENLIGVDEESLQEYFVKAEYLILGANFRTALPKDQQAKGRYGIIFSVQYKSASEDSSIERTFIFDNTQMKGTPYNFIIPTRQFAIYESDGVNYEKINNIRIFCDNFPYSEDPVGDPDIFVSNLEFGAVRPLTEDELNGTILVINTPKGSFFREDSIPEDTITLEAEVRVKGKKVPYNDPNLSYYWFIKDPSATKNNNFYCEYAGEGWHCLNRSYLIKKAEEPEEEKNHTLWNDDTTDTVDWNEEDEDNSPIIWNELSAEEILYSNFVKWISKPEDYQLEIKQEDVWSETQTYKCVVVYNGEVLAEEQIVKNKNSSNLITVISDDGVVDYVFDQGTPDFTCLVNGKEKKSSSFKYSWGIYDNNQRFMPLETTYTSYSELLQITERLKQIQQELDAEIVTESEIKVERDTLLNRMALLSKVVNRNHIYNFPISEIINYGIFSCAVYEDDIFRGTGELKVTNSHERQDTYTVIINNGNQMFKYDANGVSPAAEVLDKPQEILPLTFNVFDNHGNDITKAVLKDETTVVKWIVHEQGTMLKIRDDLYEDPEEGEDGTVVYKYMFNSNNKPITSFEYNILGSYNYKAVNNNIKLEIEYQTLVFRNSTNFTFLKDGDTGTNGTSITCRIVPNCIESKIPKNTIIYQYNDEGGSPRYKLNFTPLYANKWFNVEVFENQNNIFVGNESTGEVKVEWSVLKNRYNNTTITDHSNIEYIDGGFLYHADVTEDDMERASANIVQVKVTVNGYEIYATYPVYKVIEFTDEYKISIKEETGIKYGVYSSDGTLPSYDTDNLFELLILDDKGNDYSEKEGNLKFNYEWKTVGELLLIEKAKEYYAKLQQINDDETTADEEKEALRKKLREDYPFVWRYTQLVSFVDLKEENPYPSKQRVSLKSIYDGYSVNNGITCMITKEIDGVITNIGKICLPIHLMLNRYGLANLNGWDGNSIDINEDGNYILAPQIGAGRKEEDNSFSGVVMGVVKNGSKEEVGLLGFSSGRRSILLDAETGAAEFGVENGSRIIIAPGGSASGEKAEIKSGNYKYGKNGTGMVIDFAKPEIKFGSGNFEVNSEGHLTAKGGGSIAGWKISDTSLTKTTVGISSDNTEKTNIAFWAGNTTSTSAPFSVDFNGHTKMHDAEIGSGTNKIIIGKSEGNNGYSAIYSGSKTSLDAASSGFYLGTNGLAIGDTTKENGYYFKVISNGMVEAHGVNIHGKITADSGSFNGKITAQSGTIGGWKISSQSLSTEGMCFDSKEGIQFGPFKVTSDGAMKASLGKIANWYISEKSLYIGKQYDGTTSSGSVGMGLIESEYDSSPVTVAFWAGGNKFVVTTDGKLWATDAFIEGTLSSSKIIGGEIIGGKITGETMFSGDGQFTNLKAVNATITNLSILGKSNWTGDGSGDKAFDFDSDASTIKCNSADFWNLKVRTEIKASYIVFDGTVSPEGNDGKIKGFNYIESKDFHADNGGIFKAYVNSAEYKDANGGNNAKFYGSLTGDVTTSSKVSIGTGTLYGSYTTLVDAINRLNTRVTTLENK